ncbi:MAG: hypothetical protein IIT79_00730 [Aeriscardovia sp.]|nr:hypothetical protein [Aeriscardovia sp.]
MNCEINAAPWRQCIGKLNIGPHHYGTVLHIILPFFPGAVAGKGRRSVYFLSSLSLEVLACSLSSAFPFPIWVPILFGALFVIFSGFLFTRPLLLFCRALRPRARK